MEAHTLKEMYTRRQTAKAKQYGLPASDFYKSWVYYWLSRGHVYGFEYYKRLGY